VLADAGGGRLFIADSGHHRIVVTDLDGRMMRTIGRGERGFADGPAGVATFNEPQGMALSPEGDTFYVADRANHALRAIELASGAVTTVAGTGKRGYDLRGGAGRETALASPWDLTVHDGLLWIAMAGTHQLWTYDPRTGMVEPRAGSGAEALHDGPLATAAFAQPSGITSLDGLLYVADSEASAIRRVDPSADRVRRLIGRGLFEFGDVDARADSVRLQHLLGVCATREEGASVVYLADSYNDKIKRLDPETRVVETLLGGAGHGLVDGPFEAAELWEPGGLSLAGRRLYIADTNNHAVRVADLDARTVRTLQLEG
jgi:sugar lactone lactonase YvrE